MDVLGHVLVAVGQVDGIPPLGGRWYPTAATASAAASFANHADRLPAGRRRSSSRPRRSCSRRASGAVQRSSPTTWLTSACASQSGHGVRIGPVDRRADRLDPLEEHLDGAAVQRDHVHFALPPRCGGHPRPYPNSSGAAPPDPIASVGSMPARPGSAIASASGQSNQATSVGSLRAAGPGRPRPLDDVPQVEVGVPLDAGVHVDVHQPWRSWRGGGPASPVSSSPRAPRPPTAPHRPRRGHPAGPRCPAPGGAAARAPPPDDHRRSRDVHGVGVPVNGRSRPAGTFRQDPLDAPLAHARRRGYGRQRRRRTVPAQGFPHRVEPSFQPVSASMGWPVATRATGRAPSGRFDGGRGTRSE